MPQYVIEREIAGAGRLTDEEIRAVSLKSLDTLHALGPQIQWLHSYVTEDKIYCVYRAPDPDRLRDHATRFGGHVVNAIYEIVGDVTPDDIRV